MSKELTDKIYIHGEVNEPYMYYGVCIFDALHAPIKMNLNWM